MYVTVANGTVNAAGAAPITVNDCTTTEFFTAPTRTNDAACTERKTEADCATTASDYSVEYFVPAAHANQDATCVKCNGPSTWVKQQWFDATTGECKGP